MKVPIAVSASAILIIVALSLAMSNNAETVIESGEVSEPMSNISEYIDMPESAEYGSAEIKVPAVDENGNGVVTKLIVASSEGSGRTLVDINQLLFWVDTQYSIQKAKQVAENYTSADLSKTDLMYSIETEAYLIEGPSAGAALAVATISAIYNQKLDPDVMITGTIESDGSIGWVGGISEKAEAAKDVGASLFIVPKGQAVEKVNVQQKSCKDVGPITYCSTEYVSHYVNVSESAGIEVREASNIGEALKYFIE